MSIEKTVVTELISPPIRSGQFCRKPFSAREQMNSITAFIDSSSIYGSSSNTARSLRENKDGLMKVLPTLRPFIL